MKSWARNFGWMLLIGVLVLSPLAIANAQVDQDIDPPTIIFTDPGDGQTNLPVNLFGTGVLIYFSEAMDPSTFTAETFVLKDPQGNAIEGQVSFCTFCGEPIARLELLSELDYSTTYTVIISGGVKDLAGNSMGIDYAFSFTTLDPDTTPPQVEFTTPIADETNVPVYVTIEAIMNEQLDSDYSDSMIVTDEDGNTVPGQAQMSVFQVFTFTPSNDLEFATTYTVSIKAGIKDIFGNAMPSDYSWSFTTKSEKEARAKIETFDAVAEAHGNWDNTAVDGSFSNIDVQHAPDSDVGGTFVTVSHDVVDSEGNILNSAFGTVFTTEDVFSFDSNLNAASLSSLQVPMFVCNMGECFETIWTVEAEWNGIGKIEKVKDAFTDISGSIAKHKITSGSELKLRQATATATLNGNELGSTSNENTFISYDESAVVRYGDFDLGPGGISISDFIAPTFEQGIKTVRGGEGAIATAFWSNANPDGTKTEINLFIADGLFNAGRVDVFSNEIVIELRRAIVAQDNSTILEQFGAVILPLPENDRIFKVNNNLRTGVLSPVAIEICSFEQVCESVTIQADWKGIGQSNPEHFRFSTIANCQDFFCPSADQSQLYRVKVIGSGNARDADVRGTLNGISLGDETFGRLSSKSTFMVEFGSPFPFEIFPIVTS